MTLRLEYENQLDYETWCQKLLRMTWLSVLCIALAETAIFIVEVFRGTAGDPFTDILIYILRPAFVNCLVMGTVQLLSCWLLPRRKFAQQGIVYVIGVALICLMLCWTHSSVPAIFAMWAFPVVVSLLYIDRRILTIAFLISVVLFLAFVFLLPATYPESTGPPDPVSVMTTLVIIAMMYFFARMILNRQAELAQSIVDAHHRTRLDSLTQLYNHATFYDQLDNYIRAFNKTGVAFCLVIIDIDNFKRINDTHGHNVGDSVLLTLVDTIREALGPGDEAFRYGGEEFTILTKKDLDGCIAMTRDILEGFKRTISAPPYSLGVTASAGICRYDGLRFGAKREFFAAADEALYKAKRTGKDRYVVWREFKDMAAGREQGEGNADTV